MKRFFQSIAFGSIAMGVLFACTLTRSLDYLQEGGEGGASSTSSTSSGGADVQQSDASLGVGGDLLVSGQYNPRNLTHDPVNLYWSSAESIMSFPKGGGAAPKTVGSAPKGSVITGLTAEPGAEGSLYFIVANSVYKLAKQGGTPEIFEDDPLKPVAIVVSDDHVFIAHGDADAFVGGSIVRYSRTVTPPTPEVLIFDESYSPYGLAIVRDKLYWAMETDNAYGLFSIPLVATAQGDGGTEPPPTVVEENITPSSAANFVVDLSAAYWYDSFIDVPGFFRMEFNPPAKKIFEAPGGSEVLQFVVDDERLFYVDARESGSVVQIPKIGGTPTPLAQDYPTPTSLISEGGLIYFAVQGSGIAADGAILKVAKK